MLSYDRRIKQRYKDMHIYLLHANKYAVIFLKTDTDLNKTKYLTHSNGCIIILKYDFYAKKQMFSIYEDSTTGKNNPTHQNITYLFLILCTLFYFLPPQPLENLNVRI